MKKINSVRRCRLCACRVNFNNFLNIFDENPELELEKKISKLLPVVVMPWDPMSHVVCYKCIEKLNSFNDFYEASLKAEEFLRELHPSISESEEENCDRVAEVSQVPDEISDLSGNSSRLQPKKRQSLSDGFRKAGKNIRNSRLKSNEVSQIPDENEDLMSSERILNCFVITEITNRDSFFTCRDCCRTFTKQSSALTHSCIRFEDCGEIEAIDLEDESKKSLPPLKIRLFSVRSGLFICYLCQAPHEDKEELTEHLKRHFLNGNFEDINGKKCNKPRGRRRGRSRYEQETDEDWEETYRKNAMKRKRKRCSGPQKRGKAKAGGESKVCQNPICLKCGYSQNSSASDPLPPTEEETMEPITQYLEIKDDEAIIVLNSTVGEESTVTVKPGTESVPNKFFEESKTEDLNCLIEIPEPVENENRSDEVTVLEVVKSKTSSVFLSCIFCEKIFSTKEALIVHHNKHLLWYSKDSSDAEEERVALPSEEDSFLCSICATMFSNQEALLEHEQCHFDLNAAGFQKKILIDLGREFPESEVEPECQISKERGIITITLTACEKKLPRIEFT